MESSEKAAYEDFCSLVSAQRYLGKDETAEEQCSAAGEWRQREVSCVLPGWRAASKASSAKDTSRHPDLPSPCSWLPFLCSRSSSSCYGVVTAWWPYGRSWILLLFNRGRCLVASAEQMQMGAGSMGTGADGAVGVQTTEGVINQGNLWKQYMLMKFS